MAAFDTEVASRRGSVGIMLYWNKWIPEFADLETSQ